MSRKAPWRTLFKIAQYAVCLTGAQLILHAFHVGSSATVSVAINASMLGVIVAAGSAWFAINTLLVSTLIAFRFRTSWWKEMGVDLGVFGLSTAATIALAPLVALVAERSAWLLPLFLVPLYAVYKTSAISIIQHRHASHDGLTGLPNRKHLFEQAQRVLDTPSRKSRVGLFLLDLDEFKVVNDTFGHRAGDRVLELAAGRLTDSVRPGDVVARLGGDEFGVLLTAAVDEADASSVARRITDALGVPFLVDGRALTVGGSIAWCSRRRPVETLRPCCTRRTSRCTRPSDTAMPSRSTRRSRPQADGSQQRLSPSRWRRFRSAS